MKKALKIEYSKNEKALKIEYSKNEKGFIDL
jgi:hypothetical protein